jgi:hypothetical protein
MPVPQLHKSLRVHLPVSARDGWLRHSRTAPQACTLRAKGSGAERATRYKPLNARLQLRKIML